MSNQTRREFLENSLFAAATAALAGRAGTLRGAEAPKQAIKRSANARLGVACVGVRGRGGNHITGFTKLQDTEVVAIVDVDEAVGRQRIEQIQKKTHRAPKFYRDIRKMLQDPSIDIVSIATPNHWHSLAAIWAVQAGKHVYVEKPVSHNISEGRRLVQAARKHNRLVQAGTQCRSMSGMRDAIDFVRSGKIGDVKLARGLCYKRRPSIGPKGTYSVPASVDYNLWLGPAPNKPPARERFHYDWHWFWDYGNGDLGNQGIHQMDIARWGLGVGDIGQSVLSYGGRLGYEDAGETANTQVSIHEYPHGKRIVFEVRGLPTPKLLGAGVGVIFYGTEGYVVVPKYTGGAAFDPKGKVIREFDGGGNHFENLVNAILNGDRGELHGEIEEGHVSSALCHLANISYRLGEKVHGKEASERLRADKETAETFGRFSEHLAQNMVNIEGAETIRFGQKLSIEPKSEEFTGHGASQANGMLTRDYRAPFVVPTEKDV